MKKLLFMFAVVSLLVSCGSTKEDSTGTDSTAVVTDSTVTVDSTKCDPAHCDTTKSCHKDSVKTSH